MFRKLLMWTVIIIVVLGVLWGIGRFLVDHPVIGGKDLSGISSTLAKWPIYAQGDLSGAKDLGTGALNIVLGLFKGVFGGTGLIAQLWDAGGVGRLIVVAAGLALTVWLLNRMNVAGTIKDNSMSLLKKFKVGPLPLVGLLGGGYLMADAFAQSATGGYSVFDAGAAKWNVAQGMQSAAPAVMLLIVWVLVGLIPGKFDSKGFGNAVIRWVARIVVIATSFAVMGNTTLLSDLPVIGGGIAFLSTKAQSLVASTSAGGATLASQVIGFYLLAVSWMVRGFGIPEEKKDK